VAFIEIKVELGRLAKALERLADAADRAFPPPRPVVESKPAGPENLFQFEGDLEFDKQSEEERQREANLFPRP
jgi:hypothetical protein